MNEATHTTKEGRDALRALAKAMPKMSDYRKGYLLGYGDAMVDQELEKRSGQEPARPASAEE